MMSSYKARVTENRAGETIIKAGGSSSLSAGRLLILVVLVSLFVRQASAYDPFRELATNLIKDLPAEGVNIGVGNFAYENTALLSPFSSLLRDELEVALSETGKLKVVTRDRLADLQIEGEFQSKNILEPGTGVDKVSIKGVEGIVRGRFYVTGAKVTVFAELAWLEGGDIKKTRVELPAAEVKAKVWPDMQEAAAKNVSHYIVPQNMEESLASIEDLAGERLAKIPKDFDVEISTTDGRRAYPAGENVSFRVRSAKECHIAVLCHQNDGTSVVLFPNRFNTNTLIPANKVISVPGTHKHGFEIEIGPPFGSDVVEVIACSHATELHQSLSKHATKVASYHFQTRGMIVKRVDDALTDPLLGSGAPILWSQDSVVVSTFPRS